MERKTTFASYILWVVGLVGICGLHRFYLGKPWTGLLWLLTGGLLFIGQIIDLFLIPGMVRNENLEGRLYDMERGRGRLG